MSQLSHKALNKWILGDDLRPESTVRIIGFPHAGGGGQAFDEWGPMLSSDMELLSVNLPGRGTRLGEPVITSMDKLAPQLIEALIDFLDKPFVFFGHSVGALFAFELTRRLQHAGYPLPLHLFVSAHRAPDVEPAEPLVHQVSDAEFLDHIEALGMTPPEVVSQPTLWEQLRPTIRADLTISETYARHQASPVNVPVTLLGGRHDKRVPTSELDRWSTSTTSQFDVAIFDGDHFYTHAHRSEIVEFIVQRIAATVATLPTSIFRGERLPYPQRCLHELFEEQVAKTPDAVAVLDDNRQLTFRQLGEQSDRLARYLQSQGVRVQSLVGIYMETSIEYVIAFFAALKAGGAYMTVEIAYPDALLQQVLNNAQPVVLLTKAVFYARLPEAWQHAAFVMGPGWVDRLAVEPNEVPTPLALPTIDSLAQCVMSSGTTGTPKGIVCSHRSAVNSYYWRYTHHPYEPGEREACNVFLVWEVARPILQGFPVYLIPDDIIYDPMRLVDYLSRHRITRILFTPSLLEQILNTPHLDLPKQLRHLRVVYLNGEVVTTALCSRFRDLFPDVTLLNDYSIAEAHDVCHVDLADQDPKYSPKYSPIGRPMSNVDLYILNDQQQPVPQGFRGEIYIGGDSVGLGYLNQPEQTAERFPRDPFSQNGSLMFRTGDAGRILPNGQVEIQGRIAFMVKLRGYTIVPGAVETKIIEHTAVNTAVVVTLDNDQTGQPEHLVAYVVGNGQVDDDLLRDVIRDYLKQHLPHYAIPSYIIPLDELPIAANGKLDRKRLPKPTDSMLQAKNLTRSTPETHTEQALAAVWQSVLPVGSVGVTDNFFDLGGHSLLAAQMVSQIREVFQVDLPIRDIFEVPTLAALAQRLETMILKQTTPARDTALICPVSRGQERPLSFAQERLWFLHQLGTGSIAYNISQVIQLSNDIDPTWLSPVFTEIVRRHEILRTNIVMIEGRPTQVIQPPYEVVIETLDLRNRTATEREVEAGHLIRQHARHLFDLVVDQMVRVQLLQVEDASYRLQLTMPHLAFDGWSMDILLREFRSLYDAFSTGQPSPLPELPVQYADFAVWERDHLHDVSLEPHAEYWKLQLAGPLPVLELPTDRPRPTAGTNV